MAKTAPQLKPEQQQVFLEFADVSDADPQELLDSMVDHFRSGAEYKHFCARIEKAEASLDAGKGIPHEEVIQKLRQRHAEKLAQRV